MYNNHFKKCSWHVLLSLAAMLEVIVIQFALRADPYDIF